MFQDEDGSLSAGATLLLRRVRELGEGIFTRMHVHDKKAEVVKWLQVAPWKIIT